jgi:hypothetical protein
MSPMLASLLFLCAGAFAGTPPADPSLDQALSGLVAQGYKTARIVRDTVHGVPYAAVLLRDAAHGFDKLNVYARLQGRSLMVYTHPGTVDRLEFSRLMLSDREFPNLLRDGSRVVSYRALTPGLTKTSLYVLRLDGKRVRRVAVFPEGRFKDVDDDGRMEVISRDLPLGRFFSVGCEEFRTVAQTAFQTRIYSWRNGRFDDVSAKYPAFFTEDLAAQEEKLALIPKERKPGEYVAGALTVYFDYASEGKSREGWRRLCELIKPPSVAVPHLAACVEKVKGDLRQELSIPADW